MPDHGPSPASGQEAAGRPIELEGASVLIIGAGGPMGRQFSLEAVRHRPGRLLLADDRVSLSRIDAALAEGAELIAVDIDDRPGLRAVLAEHHPDIVVHVTPPSHAVVDDRPIEWPALPADQASWLAVDAAEAGCRHFLRVSSADLIDAGGPGGHGNRHDPETSDASLRAALENERANADHLRRLSRQQKEILRRKLVRIALVVDEHARRLDQEVTVRQRRVTRRLSRAELIASSLPGRRHLAKRRAELFDAIAELPEAPVVHRRISVIIVTDRPMTSVPPSAGVDDCELVIVLSGRAANPPPHHPAVVVRSDYKTITTAAATGASRATGRLLCFFSPTSEPLDDHWLARLAAAIEGDTVAATPMLVHPEHTLRDATPHDLRVRELGLDILATESAGPVVRAREAGTRPRPSRAATEVAASSGGCFIVDRRAYVEAGGLAPIDDFDAAVVDLCGRLRAGGGRVITVPSSVVADHRPVTSVRSLARPIDPESPAWRSVVDRQGPTLLQLARGDRVTEHLRIALTVAAPSARAAAQWGDWHLATALAKALRRLGHSVHLQTADQADDPAGRSCDVHIVFRGLAPVQRTAGQRHVVWVISHPESIDIQECDDADLVMVASERFAADLRQRTSTPVEVLLQATDPRRFHPHPPDPEHAHAVAVVAMTRHQFRPSVANALAVGLRPAIYGTGWQEFVDPDLMVSDFVPNDQLATVYSSVGVLLNDHWDTMRAWGFVSNRLFDALACGTPIVSDHMPEVEALFGDAVAMYRNAEELRRAVDAALDDPIAARRRANRGRDVVLENHTFDDRARQLLDALARYGLDTPPR
jgi:hypothetical protein